jgi:archaellum component FlaF (FlaF/FlaG flagellin family)
MALSDTSKTLISIKKLVGKAHTSNDKAVANEALPSGLGVSSHTVFGQSIPTTADQSSNALYTILTGSGITGNGQVEYLRFQASFIAGTDTSSGRHGFELKLPSDYETNSKNPLRGTYPFVNNQSINITSGSLQLVSPSFSTSYEAKAFYGGNTTKDNGTQIPVLDARDWFLDYFNGIFFQQDPPGTGDHANNPDFVQGYLYIGKFANEGMFETGLSGSLTQLSNGTSYLVAGSNVTITTGSAGSITIASEAGASDSTKIVHEITASEHAASNRLYITNFTSSAAKNNPNKLDVFVNGQLMTSGSTKDYILGTGSDTLLFSFSLIEGDIVTTRNY